MVIVNKFSYSQFWLMCPDRCPIWASLFIKWHMFWINYFKIGHPTAHINLLVFAALHYISPKSYKYDYYPHLLYCIPIICVSPHLLQQVIYHHNPESTFYSGKAHSIQLQINKFAIASVIEFRKPDWFFCFVGNVIIWLERFIFRVRSCHYFSNYENHTNCIYAKRVTEKVEKHNWTNISR